MNYYNYILIPLIYILSFIIYLINPIRYSNDTYLYIPLHKLYYYISIIIHILNLVFMLYINTKYQITNKYILIIPFISGIILINIIYSKPIINDDSYNIPPSFLKKNTKTFILILLLLCTLLILHIPHIIKDTSINNKYLFLVLPINIIIILIITYKYIKYSPCKYNLPISWYF